MSVPQREIDGLKSRELTCYPHLQMHFEHAQDAIVLMTDEGLCVDANGAACVLWGRSRDALIQRSLLPLTSILEQIDPHSPQHAVPTSPAEWQSWSAFQVIQPDQSRRDVMCIMAADLSAHTYLIVLRDITAQKAADAQVQALSRLLQQSSVLENRSTVEVAPVESPQRSEAVEQADRSSGPQDSARGKTPAQDGPHSYPEWLFRAVFDQTFQLSSLLTPSGAVVEDNQTALDFCQLPREAVVGRPFWELHCWTISGLTQARLQEAIAQAASGQTVRYETDIFAPDQSIITVDFSIKPLLNPQGQVEFLLAEGRDLSSYKQLEQELRSNQQKYQNLYEILPVAIAITDSSGQIIEANEAAEQLLGLAWYEHLDALNPAVGWQIVDLDGNPLPPDRYPSVQALRDQQTVRDVELGVVHPDGSTAWICVTAAPIPLGGYGVAIAAIDISDRRRAEIALQRQAQQEQALNQVIQVIRSSLDLHIIFAQSAAHIAEFLTCEVSIVEYVPERHCWIHRAVYDQGKHFAAKVNLEIPDEGNPFAAQLKQFQVVQVDDTRTIEDPINRELAEATPGSWLLTPIVVTHRLWGSLTLGRSHEFSTWSQDDIALAQRVADQLGIAIAQAHLYQQLNTELSERRMVETALRKSEDRYRRIVETANEGIWLLDVDHCTRYVNQAMATMLGRGPNEILGLSLLDFVEDDYRDLAIAQLNQHGTRGCFDCKFLRQDGSEVWAQLSTCPFIDESGNYGGALAMVTDITDRKRSEEMLRHYERIVSATPDAVSLLNRNYMYLVVNQPYLDWHEKPRHQIVGHSVAELFGHDIFERLLKPSLDRALSGDIVRFQDWFDYAQGGRQFVSITYSPYFELDGTISGVVTTTRIMTELKLAELALQRQTEREQLLATITHRIRRSLNLQNILETAVCEVRAFLKTDRTLVYQLTSDRGGMVVAESVEPGWISILGFEISDPCLLEESCLRSYIEGKVQTVSDLQTANLSDCYVEMLSGFQVRASLVLPILEGERVWGLLIAQHCLGPRVWEDDDVAWLKRLTDQLEIAIQQSQLYEQTVLQARRETLFNEIVTTIRHSLNLDDVLRETADKLQQALQTSRSMVALQSEGDDAFDYMLIATASGTPACQAQHLKICTSPDLQQALGNGEPLVVDEVIREPLLEATLPQALQMGVQSMMLIAIQMDGRNKGMICVQQCDRVRRWTFSEQLLMKQVSDQLAIAIQQVELYQEVQQLNADLEDRVEARTAELNQALHFESLLKHITDKVRDSLDEQQILQTAVEELSRGLRIECCDTGLYNDDQTVSTIAYEYTRSLQPVQGTSFVIAESTHPEIYPFLFQGQTCLFCDIAPNTLRTNQWGMAILACPIMDDRKAVGDLWLFKDRRSMFSEVEVRFVQQVANQCAIALRQAHLYHAVQTQVVELERLNQLKDDFLSTVSHELRTPMANIKMAIQMVEIQLSQTGALTADGSSNLDRYFNILKEECQRETQLINNLLDLTRLDSGMDPLMPMCIDLRLWVQHVAEVFLDCINTQQQQLQIDIPENITLKVDLSYLERILMELFNNACKYTPSGETISVIARADQQITQLRVSNSGVEIPPVECERIFEKFYRIPNNDPWKHGGTGLGLALVKKLTEKMGGRIYAECVENQLHVILEFPNPSPGIC